ncbi:MAG: PfkB family carbohydrate kinase [Tannerellaceae bacterium]|jgi:2-dehydro-3-deoxygluconokinase|nr:PfkB family carbohydrate kinase [Tannerellaceae bacterium]
MMQLKKYYQWALVAPTSMGIRLTPTAQGQPVDKSHHLLMQATSAESNAVTPAACLGLPVKVLTAFVKDSPIAQFIKDNLRQRNIHWEGPEKEQGGPWGFRHQINFADSGFGVRGPRVWNDRSGEVGRSLSIEDFSTERLYRKEGVQMLHLSGLIAALSPESGQLCLELAGEGRRFETKISFDLNYRASFWQAREEELRKTFRQIASVADILVGNEEDFQLCLGIEGPEAGGKDVASKIESFKGMIRKVKQQYPQVQVFATTLREVVHANRHLWGAILLDGEQWHVIEPRPIEVLDRIGGGDGFVGGLLYGILKGWEAEQYVRFGWAAGALATTLFTDYAQPVDEDQVWSIWNGNARVLR